MSENAIPSSNSARGGAAPPPPPDPKISATAAKAAALSEDYAEISALMSRLDAATAALKMNMEHLADRGAPHYAQLAHLWEAEAEASRVLPPTAATAATTPHNIRGGDGDDRKPKAQD